jgi:hypothetical protein
LGDRVYFGGVRVRVVEIQGKTTSVNDLPEQVAASFLKQHLADKYYLAVVAGRIAIEWGTGHQTNPSGTWWRFAKPDA